MRWIGANCREQLRADDFEFVAAILAGRSDRTASMTELLTDPAARDEALDSEAVFLALVDHPAPLPVSAHLYFYVLTRHGLGRFERAIADYIANVLAAFLDSKRARTLPATPDVETEYLTEMLEVLSHLSGRAAFVTRAHVGNYSLFMSGIFADHIRYRAWRRGAPGIAFYEEVGSASYRIASGHDQAKRRGLDGVFRTIGESFSEVREGLNVVADRFLHLEGGKNIDS